MRVIGQFLLLAGYVILAACGSAEPKSPLILGKDPADVSLGNRSLNASETRALQEVITSAGESCGSIQQSYLRDLDVVTGSESWQVRCDSAAYAVLIRADGTPSAVERCFSRGRGETPCQPAYGTRRPYNSGRREPQGGPLNPDLGKLLEPMTAKDGKTD